MPQAYGFAVNAISIGRKEKNLRLLFFGFQPISYHPHSRLKNIEVLYKILRGYINMQIDVSGARRIFLVTFVILSRDKLHMR